MKNLIIFTSALLISLSSFAQNTVIDTVSSDSVWHDVLTSLSDSTLTSDIFIQTEQSSALLTTKMNPANTVRAFYINGSRETLKTIAFELRFYPRRGIVRIGDNIEIKFKGRKAIRTTTIK